METKENLNEDKVSNDKSGVPLNESFNNNSKGESNSTDTYNTAPVDDESDDDESDVDLTPYQ